MNNYSSHRCPQHAQVAGRAGIWPPALAGPREAAGAVAVGRGHPGWAVPALLPAEHGLCASFPYADAVMLMQSVGFPAGRTL